MSNKHMKNPQGREMQIKTTITYTINIPLIYYYISIITAQIGTW